MNSNTFEFREAKKMITSPDLLDKFLKGKTFNLIIDFICVLQKSVEGKTNNNTKFSEVITKFYLFNLNSIG